MTPGSAIAPATHAEAEAHCVVHDQVIGALALTAMGGDLRAAGEACKQALAALADLNPTTSAIALQDGLAATGGIRVVVLQGSWSYDPPIQVITALREAAGEAVRNARRHSGVEKVTVQLFTSHVNQVGIRVRDEGCGFRIDAAPGFGLRRSIASRVHGVGGLAAVTSAPGTGTTVTLAWPAQPAVMSVQESLATMQAQEQAWLETSRVSRHRIAAQLQADVSPFLELCANGHTGFTPDLRVRAVALAAQCRDFLSHGDSIPTEVRAAVLAARRRGTAVNIRVGSKTTPETWWLLQAVLRRIPQAVAVTIVPITPQQSARVTVLPRVRPREAKAIGLDLPGVALALESTSVSSSFLLAPQWATSVEGTVDLESTA